MKEREKFSLRLKALTAQGRLSAYVIGAMPLLIFLAMYAVQPKMMGQFISTSTGIILMSIAAIMVIIGLIVVKRIVSIEV